MTKEAVLYARVSTDPQSEKWPLPSQEKLIKEYSRKQAVRIVKAYVVTESGWRKGKRHEFDSMIKFVEDQGIKNILALNEERLLRDLGSFVKLEHLIRDLGVRIHFVETTTILDKENEDGLLFLTIKVGMARQFIDKLKRKAIRAITQKREAGEYYGGIPLGYVLKDGRLEIDQPRVPMIREMFKRYDEEGHSLNSLVDLLWKEGYRTRKGMRIAKQTVRDVLRNPAYIGYVCSEGKMIKATHEAIIDRDLFDRVQKKLTIKGCPHPTAKKEFLYKGLIRCSECHRYLVGEVQRGIRYYHCTSQKCRGTWYREDRIAFWQEFADARPASALHFHASLLSRCDSSSLTLGRGKIGAGMLIQPAQQKRKLLSLVSVMCQKLPKLA